MKVVAIGGGTGLATLLRGLKRYLVKPGHTVQLQPAISRLTAGTELSRQAVTKHLQVLEDAGVVRSVRVGRENLFALEPKSIEEARKYLERVSAQWDDALARLKSLVED